MGVEMMIRAMIDAPASLMPSLRHRLARVLARASARAWRQAKQWAATGRRPVATEDPMWEFHAEAGAPEGALYVNGELVGHVAVTRL